MVFANSGILCSKTEFLNRPHNHIEEIVFYFLFATSDTIDELAVAMQYL
jgi:hypothetical protein